MRARHTTPNSSPFIRRFHDWPEQSGLLAAGFWWTQFHKPLTLSRLWPATPGPSSHDETTTTQPAEHRQVLRPLLETTLPRTGQYSGAAVGTIDRFRSADAFATYTGTAPIAASPGDVTRHRLSRAGDRQLNCCLHTMAISQIARDTPDAITTDENAPPARATEKHYAATKDASPMSSTDN